MSSDVDESSVLIGCHIKKGIIRNSLLVGVTANTVDIADSVAISCTCDELVGQKCLLYNVVDEGSVNLMPNTVAPM